MIPSWGKVNDAAKYAGVSSRTLEDWLKAGILRFSQLPSGTRLIKFEWIDQALEKFEVQLKKENPAARIADDVIKEFQGKS
jgi:excisionase family DNA binding protein